MGNGKLLRHSVFRAGWPREFEEFNIVVISLFVHSLKMPGVANRRSHGDLFSRCAVGRILLRN